MTGEKHQPAGWDPNDSAPRGEAMMPRRRFWLWLSLAAVGLAACTRNERAAEGEGKPETGFGPSVETEYAVGAYVARIYDTTANNNPGRFEILHHGKSVLWRSGFRFYLETQSAAGKANQGDLGTSITGDGIPTLVMKEWTGGAHCCFRLHLFALGPTLRSIQTIDVDDNEVTEFENLDADSALELTVRDMAFAYWKTSFAASPAPRVVLKFRDGQYHIAPELMRRLPPPAEKITEMAKEYFGDVSWREGTNPPVDLWGDMLELLYTGNAREAWALLGEAWPPGVPGKEDFRSEFTEKLKTSRYWPELNARFAFAK